MFNYLELDALKEISNIGAGNAATALSKILSKKVEIKIPDVKILTFDQISEYVGAESEVAGIFLRINGDIEGNIVLLIPKASIYELLKSLLGEENLTNDYMFSEMEESALIELGNIVASSYIASLSDFTKLNLKISVPCFAFDMAGAILNLPLSMYGYMGDTTFLLDTEFIEKYGVKILFFLIPDNKQSLKVLLKAIGVNSDEGNNQGWNGGI